MHTIVTNMGDREPMGRLPGPELVAEANEARELALSHPRGRLLIRLLDGWSASELASEEGVSIRTIMRWIEEVKAYVRAKT